MLQTCKETHYIVCTIVIMCPHYVSSPTNPIHSSPRSLLLTCMYFEEVFMLVFPQIVRYTDNWTIVGEKTEIK